MSQISVFAFCPIRLLLFDLFQRDENGYNLANMIKTIIFKTLIVSAHLLDSYQFFLLLFISEWRWNFSNNSVERGGCLLYDFWWTQTPVLTPSTGWLGCQPQMTLWTKLPMLFSSALSQKLWNLQKQFQVSRLCCQAFPSRYRCRRRSIDFRDIVPGTFLSRNVVSTSSCGEDKRACTSSEVCPACSGMETVLFHHCFMCDPRSTVLVPSRQALFGMKETWHKLQLLPTFADQHL